MKLNKSLYKYNIETVESLWWYFIINDAFYHVFSVNDAYEKWISASVRNIFSLGFIYILFCMILDVRHLWEQYEHDRVRLIPFRYCDTWTITSFAVGKTVFFFLPSVPEWWFFFPRLRYSCCSCCCRVRGGLNFSMAQQPPVDLFCFGVLLSGANKTFRYYFLVRSLMINLYDLFVFETIFYLKGFDSLKFNMWS